MSRYEYIRIEINMGDLGNLSELNRFSSDGWRVVTVVEEMRVVWFEGTAGSYPQKFALLERPIER